MRIPEGPVVLLALGRLGVESVEKVGESLYIFYCRQGYGSVGKMN